MKIWDLPTRFYHWLQALLFIGLVASGNSGEGPHLVLGLALFTLVIWRVLWGVVGSETSQFKAFVASPKRVVSYLMGREKAQPGHNPAGSWMVVVLIVSLLMQCSTGIVISGLLDNMPFAETLLTDSAYNASMAIHSLFAKVLQALVAVHLLAILVYKLRSKPLVWAMVSGKQKNTLDNPNAVLAFSSNKRALLMLLAAGLVTMTIVVSSLV